MSFINIPLPTTVSTTGLKEFIKFPRAFADYKNKEESLERKKHLDVGRVVDTYLTQGERFSDLYFVMDAKMPSGKGGIFLNYLMSKAYNEDMMPNFTIADVDAGLSGPLQTIIQAAYIAAEYSWTIEKVWEGFQKKDIEILKTYVANSNKYIIDADTHRTAVEMYNAVKNSPAYYFFNDMDMVRRESQLDLQVPDRDEPKVIWRAILDLVEFNGDKKATIISLKTSKSKYLNDVLNTISDYKYYIQQIHETCLLKEAYPHIESVTYLYVFVSSVAPYVIRVFQYEENTMQLMEYAKGVRNIKTLVKEEELVIPTYLGIETLYDERKF